MCCTTKQFRYLLKHCFNFYYDESAQTITYDSTYFDAIESICIRICHELDSIDWPDDKTIEKDWRGNRVTTWDILGLSGDDDGDYNGSYIESVIDWLRDFDKSLTK